MLAWDSRGWDGIIFSLVPTVSGISGFTNRYETVSTVTDRRIQLPSAAYWLGGLILVCVLVSPLRAQQPIAPADVTPTTDSLANAYSKAVADSVLAVRDSIFYSNLKSRMYKHRLTRQLYDALFHDVYNSRVRTGQVSQIEVNPFQPFEGRIIGSIYVRRLDVFGQSVYDTLRRSNNWIERLGNRVHTNTQESVIRRYLLFEEGDAVTPNTLRDNERLLRNTSIFHDARIFVVPKPNSRQFVDVYVITQDVWSLLPTGGLGSLNNFQAGFEQRNVRGMGHQFFNQVNYNGRDPRQRLEYQARYTVPYIRKTFITAQADLLYLRDQKKLGVRVFRPFLTPDTKYAGAVELSVNRVRNYIIRPNDRDTTLPVDLGYSYSDVWLGRSFKLFFGNPQALSRARIVVAGRMTRYSYDQRPALTADTNQLYQNSRTTLFSVGFSQRRYIRDVLIYGFGRTEDVPYGDLISVVGGVDNAELGERAYAGVNFSRGQYMKKFGYLYTLINAGTFYRNRRAEQGVFSFTGNYFSPLLNSGWGKMRHFLNVRYTIGGRRFNNEYVTLNGSDGLGITNDALIGTKRLLVGFENVLFSNLSLAGFRVAFITSANLGMVSFAEQPLLKSPIYQSYGIGFRFRNENLTFNSFQIRFTWYPNLPDNPQLFRFAFEGIPNVRFNDFDISAPAIVPYR